MKLAIFDFDGTLYKEETFSLLMSHLKEHPAYGSRYKKFYRSILAPYIGYKLRLYPERKMKMQLMQRYLRAFFSLSEKELDYYFAEIAEAMKENFNRDVVAKLHKHADDGVFVMIVSGAFTPLLKAAAKEFPVDSIIGTEIPFKNGILDGETNIDHVQAERKAQLIHQSIHGRQIDWENSYAYGDSFSDMSVLKLVGNPVAVCPDDKLRVVAVKNNWKIMK